MNQGKEDSAEFSPIILEDPKFWRNKRYGLFLLSEKTLVYITRAGNVRIIPSAIRKISHPYKQFQGLVLVYKVYSSTDDKIVCFFRSWELFQRKGEIGIFTEVPDLARSVDRVDEWAYRLCAIEDDFCFSRAHIGKPDNYLVEAVKILQLAFQGDDNSLQIQAARALRDFFYHTDHGCFSKSELNALRNIVKQLPKFRRNTLDSEARKHYDEAIRTFRKRYKEGCFNKR